MRSSSRTWCVERSTPSLQGDAALYGRALLADDEGELAGQLGHQVQELAAERGFSTVAALGEVADATRAALADGATLDKNELHATLRDRVPARS